MTPADLPAISAISDRVHGAYTEPVEILAERLALYPQGCLTLEQDGAITGYVIAHPWLRDAPPRLGRPVGAIPARADTYYLHDIALLPASRGTGAGTTATAAVVAQARRAGFREVTLTAINGADRFWAAQGFAYADDTESAAYGEGTYLMRRAI
jgi:GNAT superfamily N-acetyltransferase